MPRKSRRSDPRSSEQQPILEECPLCGFKSHAIQSHMRQAHGVDHREFVERFGLADTRRRFEARVKKGDGCWEWQGATGKNGYGYMRMPMIGARPAHRLAWEFANGAIPDGLFVLHSCDNRACVNPEHLWLGTNKDNLRDAKTKGRCRGGLFQGELHCMAKLSREQAQAIRAARDNNGAIQCLADQYGITYSHAKDIAAGRSWKHLP